MKQLPVLPRLDDKAAVIAKFVVPYCRLPHPEVVSQFSSAVFPTVRDMPRRQSTGQIADRTVMWDDNTTPRWALLWSHGIPDTAHPKGWTFAHVWGTGKDPDAYTHLANLVMMPEALASLSDKDGPLCNYFRFHAESVYGWRPDGFGETAKPEGFDKIQWTYLEPESDPCGFVQARLNQLNSRRVKLIRDILAEQA